MTVTPANAFPIHWQLGFADLKPGEHNAFVKAAVPDTEFGESVIKRLPKDFGVKVWSDGKGGYELHRSFYHISAKVSLASLLLRVIARLQDDWGRHVGFTFEFLPNEHFKTLDSLEAYLRKLNERYK